LRSEGPQTRNFKKRKLRYPFCASDYKLLTSQAPSLRSYCNREEHRLD
jgi:hypothetical protein